MTSESCRPFADQTHLITSEVKLPTSETLLPCPFDCGHPLPPVPSGYCMGSAEELQTDDEKWAYMVRCHCGAEGPERSTEAEAIAAWNTRQPTSPALLTDAISRALNAFEAFAFQSEVDGYAAVIADARQSLAMQAKAPATSVGMRQKVERLLDLTGHAPLTAEQRAECSRDAAAIIAALAQPTVAADNQGVTPSGSGCQPSASAPNGSSLSGIPNADPLDYAPIGSVVWHCSEEDSGTDVGMSLKLGDTKMLWCGEITSKVYHEEGCEEYGPENGWWLIFYDGPSNKVIARCFDSGVALHLMETLG